MCTKNLHDMIYSSWYIGHDRLKLVISGHFLHFYSPKNPKIQNFEMKKIAVPKITIIWCTVPEIQSEADGILCYFVPHLPPTQNDTKWHKILYDKIEHDKQNSLTFCVIFCLFTPLTICKIKILKNDKKTPRDIIILHMCTINIIIWCMIPEIRNTTDNLLSP